MRQSFLALSIVLVTFLACHTNALFSISGRPTACTDGGNSGRQAWTSPNSAVSASGSYAYVLMTGGQFSADLVCSGYDSTITLPGGAVVRGLGIGETSTVNPIVGASVRKSDLLFRNSANGQTRVEPGTYTYQADSLIAPKFFRTTPTSSVLYSSWSGDQSQITQTVLASAQTIHSVTNTGTGAYTFAVNNVTLTLYYDIQVCGSSSEECNSTTPLGCILSTCTCDSFAGYFNPGPFQGCRPICGDDRVVQGESCETGYLGCNTTCQCRPGFFPAVPAVRPCNYTCGDGLLADPVEQCEPSLSVLGSCNSSCLCDSSQGYYNASAGVCSPICGDGIVAPNSAEECERSQGCNNTACVCDTSIGFYHNASLGAGCHPRCGDGILVPGPELCEPALSPPFSCTGTCVCDASLGYEFRGTCVSRCGDSIVSPGSSEQCDSTLGCDNSTCLCLNSTGYWHNATTNTCQARCGDGIVVSGEQCELGGFGCMDTCSCATSFQSNGSPSCLSSGGCSPPWPGPGTICTAGVWTVQSGTVLLPSLNASGPQFVVPPNTVVIVVGTVSVDPRTVIVISTGSSLTVNTTLQASNLTIGPDGTIRTTSGSIIFTQATISPSTGTSTPIFNSTSGCVSLSSGSGLTFNFGNDITQAQKSVLLAYQGGAGCAPLNPSITILDSGRCEKYKYSSQSTNQGSITMFFNLDVSACAAPSAGSVGGGEAISNVGAAVGGSVAGFAAVAAAIGGAVYYTRYRRLKAERTAAKKKLLGAESASRAPSSSVGSTNAVQMSNMK